MNIRLFLSAYRAIHNTKAQYTQEAEEFDKENKIVCVRCESELCNGNGQQ